MDIDVKYFKKRLEERKKELQNVIENSKESRDVVELDQTKMGRLSRMDALQGQAMALETNRRREVELQKIKASLERIKTGDYGYCVSCDEEIGIKRLELDPSVPTCINCAK